LLSESLHEIERAVLSNRLIQPGSRVVVGCSGGADSLALLSVLWELRDELGIEVMAAHANHQLRGAESLGDEAHVHRFCAERGIRFLRGDLDLHRRDAIGNLEDRARIARYDFLARAARSHGSLVATGHTLDDQAETFLMKMIRGAGPGGLSGIAERRVHPDPASGEPVLVLRPFLAVSRSQIEDYLSERNLAYRTDQSNLDPSFDRNWVRRQLMPLLEQRLNPRVRRTLARTARLMGEIEHHLESGARDCLSEVRLSEGQGAISIPALMELDPPLRKVAVRLAMEAVKGDLSDFSHRHVEAILDLAAGTSGRRASLPGGYVAVREFDELRLGVESTVEPVCVECVVPGVVAVPTLAKRVRITAAEQGEEAIWMPSNRVQVRNRRPGDRYQVHPGAPLKKLKKLFLEQRVPVSERDRRLVFECGGRIIWIEGFPRPVGEGSEGGGAGWFRVAVETFS